MTIMEIIRDWGFKKLVKKIGEKGNKKLDVETYRNQKNAKKKLKDGSM